MSSDLFSSERQELSVISGYSDTTSNLSRYAYSTKAEDTVIPDRVKLNTQPIHKRNELLPLTADDAARCIYTQPVHQSVVEPEAQSTLNVETTEAESLLNNDLRKLTVQNAYEMSRTGQGHGRERTGESASLEGFVSMVPVRAGISRDAVMLNEKKKAGKALAVSDVWAQVPVHAYSEGPRAQPMRTRDESARVELARDESRRLWYEDVPLLHLPAVHTKPEAIVSSSDALVMAQRMNASENEILPRAPHIPFVFQADK